MICILSQQNDQSTCKVISYLKKEFIRINPTDINKFKKLLRLKSSKKNNFNMV